MPQNSNNTNNKSLDFIKKIKSIPRENWIGFAIYFVFFMLLSFDPMMWSLGYGINAQGWKFVVLMIAIYVLFFYVAKVFPKAIMFYLPSNARGFKQLIWSYFALAAIGVFTGGLVGFMNGFLFNMFSRL